MGRKQHLRRKLKDRKKRVKDLTQLGISIVYKLHNEAGVKKRVYERQKATLLVEEMRNYNFDSLLHYQVGQKKKKKMRRKRRREN